MERKTREKRKREKRVEEISQDVRKKIREEERRKEYMEKKGSICQSRTILNRNKQADFHKIIQEHYFLTCTLDITRLNTVGKRSI